jgi:hypothetical protein
VTLPAPQTAVTIRRTAPSSHPTGAVVAAIVVVALLFIGGAAGVAWMLFGPKRTAVETPGDVAALPTPTPSAPGTPAATEAPATTEGVPGETPAPAEELSTVTIEELGVPTVPPTAAPRATAPPRPTSPPATAVATPVPEPPPAGATPAGEGHRPAEPASPASRLERVVPFRTGEPVPVGIEDRFIAIETVEATDWPKPDEIRKAEGKPGATTKVTVKFTYTNRDDDAWKCVYRVTLLDQSGKEIGSGVQERTLTGTETGDTNRVTVKLPTLDFPKVAKVRVRIVARPD